MSRYIDYQPENNRLKPLAGYWAYQLVSLEEALKHFFSGISELQRSVKAAKRYCTYPSKHNLTKDESAAVLLYTMEAGDHSLYRVLNEILRKEDRNEAKPWFPYLKLFDTALHKLPKVTGNVWRAVPGNAAKDYQQGQLLTWWTISSCSISADVVKSFLQSDQESTVFMIEIVNGKNVSSYTYYPSEEEVILGVGTRLRVKNIGFKHGNLYLVHLEELDDEDDDDSHEQVAASTATVDVTPQPVGSSTTITSLYRNKRFLFLGPTGVGKSTLVNVIYNGDVRKESLNTPARAGSTANGVTQDLNTYYDKNNNAYTDTIGFGDPSFQTDELVELFKQLIDNAITGYNRIYLCVRHGRISRDIQDYLDLIISIFGEGGLKWSTVIFTNCSDEMMNLDRFSSENKANTKIIELISQVHGVIFTDFQTHNSESIDSIFQGRRKSCLDQIKHDAANSSDYYSFPKPSDPKHWSLSIYRIIERFTKLYVPKEKILNHLRSITCTQVEHNYHYGICIHCSEPMLQSNSVFTTCGHILHEKCNSAWLHEERTCPKCEQKCGLQQAQEGRASKLLIRRRHQ